MTTKTKAFETKDAPDLYKKIIYTEGKAGRRMDKKQIEEMIDLAIKQLVILMRHIHIFMWERHFWQRMARIIQDVILKMLLIHQQTVLRGLLFLKQSVKE